MMVKTVFLLSALLLLAVRIGAEDEGGVSSPLRIRVKWTPVDGFFEQETSDEGTISKESVQNTESETREELVLHTLAKRIYDTEAHLEPTFWPRGHIDETSDEGIISKESMHDTESETREELVLHTLAKRIYDTEAHLEPTFWPRGHIDVNQVEI